MKKNGQYVGVDEQYIPEDEKYVSDEDDDEVRQTVNDGVKKAKKYIKDNKETINNVGRKGLKIAKGIGIFYISIFIFCFLFILIGMIMMIIQLFRFGF